MKTEKHVIKKATGKGKMDRGDDCVCVSAKGWRACVCACAQGVGGCVGAARVYKKEMQVERERGSD